jgi:hypothetical protein
MANSVEVLSSGQVVVTEVAEQVIEIRTATTPLTVEVATEGPQGPEGDVTGGLPTGGDPGNILIKDGYANYDSSWSAVVDGGTFN